MRDIRGLLALHAVYNHFVQEFHLGHVGGMGFLVGRRGRLHALGHEVVGHDIGQGIGVGILVADPPHQLVGMGMILRFQIIDGLHRLLDGGDVLP